MYFHSTAAFIQNDSRTTYVTVHVRIHSASSGVTSATNVNLNAPTTYTEEVVYRDHQTYGQHYEAVTFKLRKPKPRKPRVAPWKPKRFSLAAPIPWPVLLRTFR